MVTDMDAGRYHQLLLRAINRSSQDLGSLHFLKGNQQHVALACLYATIVQLTRECLTLMEAPTIGLPVILRSIVESHADLRALIKDPDHAQRMLATLQAEKQRHLESMLASPDNPFHRHLAQRLDPKAELPKVMAERDKLAKLGHKRMSNRARFAWADLENEYQAYYWLLCLESHNSVAALEDRHVNKQPNGDFEIVAVKNNSVDNVCKYCDVLTSIVSDAAVRTHEFLKSPLPPGYLEDRRDLEALRAELYGDK